MNKTTIDFGIDLGTTNSAVAVLQGATTEIIKNNSDIDITPSVVAIERSGSRRVGLRAKSFLESEAKADDVHLEFKRQMGSDYKYHFATSGETLTPEALSAEVLKSLRGDVQQRLGIDLQSAVITVPAAFEQGQCAATKAAGEMAGLSQCPLLQEPVAAALAYGYQADLRKEYWLVYDFGGGTFDAAIVKAEEGAISVVNHGGDNHLGGSDIDWAILEQIVIPELKAGYNLPDFSRAHRKRWRTALAKLKSSVETAKVQLSRSETAYLDSCTFMDADGREVEAEDVELSRDALIRVVEPIVLRSIGICKRVMSERNLAPSAFEKIILVGGPTLAPYFREILSSQLQIPLDLSVDPLTVVARGAAVFSGTQRLQQTKTAAPVAGQFVVELQYKPIGADLDPTVRGRITPSSEETTDGLAIEFVNQRTHWRSGRIPLGPGGRFKVDLLAEKGGQNEFKIEVVDRAGRRLAISPDTLSYTIGAAISEQPLTNSLAIALADNSTEVFFRKGEPLPAKATRVLRSTHFLRKGEAGKVLNVPVVEGELEKADRNRLLGTLVVPTSSLRRDLPSGSEVEVTLHVDASRIIRTTAYIPLLDEEFEAVIDHNRQLPKRENLRRGEKEEASRLEQLREKASRTGDREADEMIEGVQDRAELNSLIESAHDDPDAAQKAERKLLELRVEMDKIEDKLEWPGLENEAAEALDELDELIDAHGSDEHRSQANDLRAQVDEIIAKKLAEPLRRRIERIHSLHREILAEQPVFWIGFFKYLVDNQAKMQDKGAADLLIRQGRQWIEREDLQGLRTTVFQLLELLPNEEAEAVQRGYQSSLLR